MSSRNTKCNNCGWRGTLKEWVDKGRCPGCGITEDRKPMFPTDPSMPNWFVELNRIAMLPAFLWPLILYASVFLFDHSTSAKTTIIFLAIICYPLYLIGIRKLSLSLYKTQRTIAIILPLIPMAVYTWMFFAIFFHIDLIGITR